MNTIIKILIAISTIEALALIVRGNIKYAGIVGVGIAVGLLLLDEVE